MERQDYPAMLPQLQPPQAVAILNNRVLEVGRVNTAIADWLQERRRLEEQYSAGLRKLAQRSLEGIDLGVFSVPWTTLTGSADTLADSHYALANKIEVDVERPLREFATTNREMGNMSTIQGNLTSMAKDVDRAQQKTDKLRGKGEKADETKVATANSELDAAQMQWESQAPYVFENLQLLDETRLNKLRDVLTQFQTHEVDQVERNRVIAEQCLNVLLNVETADEIKTFAIKAVQTKPTLGRAQRNSVAIAPPQRPGPSALSPTPTGNTQTDDALSRERSASFQEDKKSRLKGLKRLGTVMGRRRESKMPVGAGSTPIAESPERRPRASPFSSFSGRLGRSREQVPTLETMQETSPRERPSEPLRLGSELFNPPPASRDEARTPTGGSQNLEPPQVNGTSLGAAVLGAGAAAGGVAAAATALNGSHQNDLADLEPPQPTQSFPPRVSSAAEPQKDSEGFSVPPQNLDPISQAQRDAASIGDGEGGASPFNVNIRDAPIQEDGASSDAALASVANKLQAPPTTARRAGTVRGRRTDRNSTVESTYIPPQEAISESTPNASFSTAKETSEPAAPAPIQTELQPAPALTSAGLTQSPSGAFAPGQVAASTFSPFSPQAEQPSPLRPESRATTGLDQSRGDTHSIRSATTTGSQAGIRHPDLTNTGLNASVVETVNARFENGKLTTSSLIGEIALAYNPADFSSPFGNENIRLENFSTLEKVAPNPAFITQTPDKEGEYSVNLSSIAKTQVAFKYQVRLDESGSQALLLIAPACKIEPNQLSVIINYSLNPAFDLKGQDSITLSNVMLALTVDGAKATSCQSKPVGTFARDKNLIYWQLNDVTLTPGAAPEKLLARFATDSEAKGGNVEARWEITGETAANLGSGLRVQSSAAGGSGDASDPFADESAAASMSWKDVQGVKRLTSGSYVAK